MNFLSVLYAKAGITVDGVTTLNNTATALTPATNDNSTKIATTAFVKNQNYYPYPTGTTAQYVRGDGSLATFPSVAAEAQRLITEVYNETGATLTKGTVVYINGGHGNLPTVTKALATSDATSAQTYGVVQNDITDNNNGFVVVIGSITDIPTNTYLNGTILYLSPITAGEWTSTKPYAPQHIVYVGIVTRSHPTQGVVEVRVQNGYEMDELHNVSAQSPANGDILQFNFSTQLWTKTTGNTTAIAEGTNLYYTDARARAAITLTTSGTSGAATYNPTTGVLNIPQYQAVLSNPITGIGSANYIARFTGTTTIENSIIYDDGTNVGIGTTNPTSQMSGTTGIGIYNASYPAVGFKNSTTAWLWYGQGATLKMWNTSYGDILAATTSGNIGIGTTNPTQKLDVIGQAAIGSGAQAIVGTDGTYAGYSTIGFGGTTNGYNRVFGNSGLSDGLYLAAATGQGIYFWTNGANTRMHITPAGNVGIGTTSPASKFVVKGDATYLEFGTGTNYADILAYNRDTSAYKTLALRGSNITFSPSDVEKMQLTNGGSLLLGGNVTPGETAWFGTAVFGKNGTDKVITGYLTSSTNGATIGGHNSALDAWADLNITGTNLIFRITQTEMMRLNSGGDLLVGTTSSIWGTANRGIIQLNGVSQALIGLSIGGASKAYLFHQGTNLSVWNEANGKIEFGTNNTLRLTIEAGGAATFSSSVTATIVTAPNINVSANNGMYDAGTNSLGFQTNGAARIFVSSAGNVGIGTTSPSVYGGGMEIKTGTQSGLRVSSTSGNSLEIGADSASGYIQSVTVGANINFYSANSTSADTLAMAIKSNGNVGIGTTSPGRKLTVQGADDGTMQLRLMGTASQTSYWEIGRESSSTGQFRFIASRNGTIITPMVIGDVSGNVGINTTAPLAILSVGAGSLADINVPIQISSEGVGTQKWIGINKNGNYGLIIGYLENSGLGGNGAYIRQVASDPMFFVVNSTTVALTLANTGAATFSSSVTATNFIGAGTGLTGTASGLSIGGNAATATYATTAGALTSMLISQFTNDAGYITSTSSTFSYTASVTLSPTWQNTGVSSANLGTGTYLVNCFANDAGVGGGQYDCTYAGIMYFYAGGTNGSNANEIVLHHTGHADNGRYIYLRTLSTVTADGKTYLQISGNGTNSAASNYQLTFKKLL